MPSLQVDSCFDPVTNTVTHLAFDADTRRAAVIDPVLDFDPASGVTRTTSADRVMARASIHQLDIDWILETHAHADHLSAAQYLKRVTGAAVGIGNRIVEVQRAFARLLNLEPGLRCDGSQFDRLFADGEVIALGSLEVRVLHTPGHTPACVSYLIGDAAFVGDTLFMPDYGTARCDFPGADAAQLHRSIQRILALDPATRLFLCHDYKTPSRDTYAWETTVAAQRRGNIHVQEGVSEAEFVALRRARDATLEVPRLLYPSIQVNIRAGHFPPAEPDGKTYLKIPLLARLGPLDEAP